jgi:macrolide transport system ATP-binding/permease protein
VANWLRKLGFLVNRGRYRRELAEEISFHRAEAERRLIAEGMSPEAARTAVARQL